MQSRLLLSALRRRVVACVADPLPHIEPDGGWVWTTFYTASMDLGLLAEAEARPANLVLAHHADQFTATDVTRGLLTLCQHGVTPQSTADVLKPYRAVISRPVMQQAPGSHFITILRALMHAKLDEAEAAMLGEFKNFIAGCAAQRLETLQNFEVAELFLCMSKLGKACQGLTPELIDKILHMVKSDKSVTGSVAAAVSRCSNFMQLPSPSTEDFINSAFDAAVSGECGGQHQVTILRALVQLEQADSKRFGTGKATMILDIIKEKGLLNLEGPNIGMMFSILAARRENDDEFITEIYTHLLPQLRKANAITISSVTKNVAFLGINFPARLCEACARRTQQIVPNESKSEALTLLTSVSRVVSTSQKARELVLETISTFVNDRCEDLDGSDLVKITRVLSVAFGRFRRRSAAEQGNTAAITHEIDGALIEGLLTRIAASTMSIDEFLDTIKNLVELELDHEEIRPVLARAFTYTSMGAGHVARLTRSLRDGACYDRPLLQWLSTRLISDRSQQETNRLIGELLQHA